MKEKFFTESKNLDQSSANENASDGAPNEHTDTGEGSVPYGGPDLNDGNGAEISEKSPHLKSLSESDRLDTERSSSTGPDKDKTNASSLAGGATGPRTVTRLPSKPRDNRHSSGPPANLLISGSYAKLAQKALPEADRIALGLAEGATYNDGVAMVLFGAAMKGNVPAARELREGIEGRANQRLKPVGAESFEVVVTWEQPPLSQMLPADSPDAPHE